MAIRPYGGGARGGGGSPTPAVMNVLEVRSTVPSTSGFSVGDVISVSGEVLVLVDDDTDANVLRGVAAAGTDDYRGVNQVTGGANNYGSWTDPAYQGEVSWYTVGGGGSPSWRIRLPDGPLGGSPPATIYAQIVAADGQTTDAALTRDQARDGTALTAYASGNDDPRAEIPVGMDFTVRLWSDRFNGAALDVHDVERWEKYHLVAGPDVPPTREQVYHQVREVLRAGAGITVTPDDDEDEIALSATGGAAGAAWLVRAAPAAAVHVDSAVPSAAGAWGSWMTICQTAALTSAQTGECVVIAHSHLTSEEGLSGGDRCIVETRLVRYRGAGARAPGADGDAVGDTVLSDNIEYGPRRLASGAQTSDAYAAASQNADEEHVAEDDAEAGDVYLLQARVVTQRVSVPASIPTGQPADGSVRLTGGRELNDLVVVSVGGTAASGAQGQQSPGAGVTLDSLIGTRHDLAPSQAQSRLTLTSPGGARVSAAGDRVLVRWAWHTRPGGVADDSYLSLALVPAGLSPVEPTRIVWDDTDGGWLEWALPAGVASVRFEGVYDPAGVTTSTTAVVDLATVRLRTGTQGVADYVTAIAASEAAAAAEGARQAAAAYADAGDAVTSAVVDATVSSLVRRAAWARAWTRAANQAAALAGTGAATWTNQGAGTPPTGAHWDPDDVPSGAGTLYELIALRSPTPGSTTAWTFGTWTALAVDATNTQYSVDGSSSWHAVRADADRYERHFSGGAWGPAIALYTDDLDWTLVLEADLYHATVHWLPGILLALPSTVNFTHFSEMRLNLRTVVGGATVLYSSLTVDPRIFISAPWADRADTSPETHTIWQMRLNGAGLSVVHGNVAFGTNGPWANGLDAGLSLVWVRPNAVSSAVEAAHLRCIYLRNRGVTHRLRIEGR